MEPGPASAEFADSLGNTGTVATINGFSPSLNDSFTILTFSSYTGTFATENLPGLPQGLFWSVLYGPSSVVLTVGGLVADLALTKSDSPDPTFVGDTLTYALNVTNACDIGTMVASAGVSLVIQVGDRGMRRPRQRLRRDRGRGHRQRQRRDRGRVRSELTRVDLD